MKDLRDDELLTRGIHIVPINNFVLNGQYTQLYQKWKKMYDVGHINLSDSTSKHLVYWVIRPFEEKPKGKKEEE